MSIPCRDAEILPLITLTRTTNYYYSYYLLQLGFHPVAVVLCNKWNLVVFVRISTRFLL
jgi:hypothetical protein